MNFPVLPSALLRFCIVITLLCSLWVSGAQDLLTQDVLSNGDIELVLDTDSQANDSFEQAALISHPPTVSDESCLAVYTPLWTQPVVANCFPPPDRPPAVAV